MAFLKFNKQELVNLSYSLRREIILANRTGACCNTSIVTCNTRRYHGLLSVPVDRFGGDKYLLLSSLDESLIVGGKQFNLGIHCYGDIYEPRGHKYIVDFEADPAPEIVYKVGEVIFAKSIVLAPDKDQVLIRYELRQAPRKIGVLLKPFLLKAGVWGWGTALNTQDLSVSVTAPEHPLFEGLTVTDGEIQLFSQCNTNAVTAISAWTLPEGEPQVLASPVSNSEAASIAILPQGMIMIGVSEYSTAHLTTDGMRLIENAIFLQLGIENNHPSGFTNDKQQTTNHKYIQNGQLLIQTGDAVYDITGRRISR